MDFYYLFKFDWNLSKRKLFERIFNNSIIIMIITAKKFSDSIWQ